ncbi:MAG: hypothetical protein P8N76_10020 [Pirellulaceae bacterium]|nr:hypothetical protein [Pirellulaceae bacterium]
MSLQEAAILLGCHGFDDFPVHHEGEAAESLLASWTALWHPQLIAAIGKMPTWHRVDDPPSERCGCLWVVPTPYANDLEPSLVNDLTAQDSLLIESPQERDSILKPALAKLNAGPSPPALADDFMALGYAYLQVELLTRQMRYSTTVEETSFEQNLVAAARLAMNGEEIATREKLQSCFDFLAQERDHYYAVDVFLIDITLLDASLLGDPLLSQLQTIAKSNLIMSGEVADQLAATTGDSLSALQAAVADQNASIIGGDYRELPLSLLSIETLRAQISRSVQALEATAGVRPTVYARRQFGLTPSLPQLLNKLGYRAALHATFDGGQFPEATQSKSRWEGNGQVSIDAILRAPLDATNAATFLSLASSISDSMDMDHVATRCFTHWAGQTSPWYRELQRITQYTHALGRFVTLEEYFDETYDPGMHERFTADQYRSPRLTQCPTDPISSSINYWRQELLLQSLVSCSGLQLIIDDQPEQRDQYKEYQKLAERFALTGFDNPEWQDQEPELQLALEKVAHQLATQLNPVQVATTADRLAIVNPLGFPRRTAVLNAGLSHCPPIKPPVYASDEKDAERPMVVDTPSMGIAFIDSAKTASSPGKSPELLEETTLRNEFFEACIDTQTGGLRTIRDYSTRGNRLSQQLAFRFDRHGGYTHMVADSVQTVCVNRVQAAIESRGKLIDDAKEVIAEFSQTFRVIRGSRVLEVETELQPTRSAADDRWNSYFASRFAWSNEAAELDRALNGIRCPSTGKRLEAPLFIQIDDGQQQTAILTGGLPYHRKMGMRMLDSLLIVKGESQRKFKFGIGIDLKHPFRESQALLAPDIIVPDLNGDHASISSWLMHIDAKHVQIISWEPWLEQDRVVGIRLRLCESEGRPGQVQISAFRSFDSARKTDFQQQTLTQCEVKDDKLRFQISPHELTEIEARFQA